METMTFSLGGYGQTIIDGGSGNDTLEIGLSKVVYPNDTNDNYENFVYNVSLAEGLAGNDQLISIENIDYFGSYNSEITGDEKDNNLSGGSADDIIRAGAGNDIIHFNGGNDELYGEDGDDYFYNNASGYAKFDGGSGSDTVSTSARDDNPFIVDLVSGYFGSPTEISDPRYDTLVSIENFVVDTDADVTMIGNQDDNILRPMVPGNDILEGGAGNDTLNAGSGDDHLKGGEGDDILVLGGSGDSIFDGGAGIDTFKVNLSNWKPSVETYPFDYSTFTYKVHLVEGFAGSLDEPTAKNNDDLISIENIDYTGPYNAQLTGNDEDNIIHGGSGDDVIVGGIGNDTLSTGDGNDNLDGGAGNDILILSGSGTSTLDGGDDIDTFKVDLTNVEYDEGFVFLADLNTDFVGSKNDPTNPLNDTILNIENIDYTGSIEAELLGDENDNVISSGSGDDVLRGGAGNDTLMAGAGDDQVFGDDGDDLIIQNGSGNQSYDGGADNDTLEVDTSFVTQL